MRRHRLLGWLGVAFALPLLMLATFARANEPTLQWRTITTPHFHVHYYKSIRHDLAEVAQRVARAAERSHDVLVPIFHYEPGSRTHVVVTDDADGANGSATIVPYNVIRVYVTRPDSRSALDDHDDWLYALFMHEYTHILHIDTIHGLPRLVNAVMGKIWAPNQIQPRWFIEGLAVHQETVQTSGGRNRSAIYDMYLRMAILEGKLLEIDQISSATRYYPRGAVPYLYGGRFIKFLADRYGTEALSRISHQYGGQALPYALNRVAKEQLGKSYLQLYDEFRKYLWRRYALQKAAAQRRGLTPFDKITDHGWTVESPRFSTDGGELVYIAGDGKTHQMMRVIDPKTGRRSEQHYHLGGQAVGFSPDGRYLVYGQTVRWRTYHNYHDLFVKRRNDNFERQLTDGLRAREPDVSPDGRSVVFVTNDLGRNQVRIVPFEGGPSHVVIQGGEHEQLFTPRWSPDGRSIVLSRRQAGYRDVVLFDLESKTIELVTDDRAVDMDPQFSRDGQRIYFSSDRTGIFNVYCHDRQHGELYQVTNVLGGAFAPAVSPDETQLYYVGFSAQGYDLHRTAIDRKRYLPSLPYVNDRPAVSPPAEDSFSEYVSRSYSPWSTLYPRSWSFSVGTDAFGTAVGIEVGGEDVVGRHAYNALLNISTTEGYLSYGLSYSYRRFWPSFSLNTSRLVAQRGGVTIDGEQLRYVEENYGVGGSIGLPVLRMPDHSVTISVGYQANWFHDADGIETVVEPDMRSPTLPEEGRLVGVTFSASYQNIERYAWSVSAEKGRRLTVSLRADSSIFGSDYESTRVTWSWTEYLPMPWLEQHVLALRYGGGIAQGSFEKRGFFFVGGFPEQNVLQAVIDQVPMGGVYLRGYAPGSLYGDQFHLVNVEYRMPLFNIERGLSTLPLYINYMHLAAFSDVGNAFFGAFDFSELKVGVGGELLTEWILGYVLPLTFRIGYARGLMEGGENQFFFLLGNRF